MVLPKIASPTESTVVQAYASKEGWNSSDTITENYVKREGKSVLQLSKITGEPLGGTSNLSEDDSVFVIRLTVPY
ncbi:MAG: hypothetical protein HQK83_17595, partial [Fibrobacteria bacterium]|nr:hypothetical protein [Fibrobacteria bacterium]